MSPGSRLFPLALACIAGAAPARAETCDISPQSVSFGAYDPTEPGDLEGVGTIAINCDTEVTVTVSLGTGAGTYDARTLTGGSGQLSYNLFTTSQRLFVWGDGSGGSDSVTATLTSRELNVYGTIPARQNVSAGAYADTIVVTITF